MTHLSNIEQALLKIHSYTGEQLTLFTSKITPRKLNKNELLLKPGQMSNYQQLVKKFT
ncbi:hypothetical protein SAMN05216436_1332 [bacterium A37T11]|nr:hypothetical protein SAMN05216436_1332 [bacterium A37T11]